jgi:hypothetical protein
MRSGTVVALSALFAITFAGAQQPNELLQAVDSAKALRLEEYNSVFLKEALYFAARHRIVTANAALLLTASEITVTPFDDAPVINLIALPGSPEREFHDQHVFWRGRYREYPLDIFGPNGPPPPSATIASHAWDLTASGEQIKQLDSLEKHAFYSVSAVFEPPGAASRYILMPLKYTPRYSVIFEIRRDTVIPVRTDVTSPEDAKLSAEERAVADRYREFLNGLPKETDKVVLGDVP